MLHQTNITMVVTSTPSPVPGTASKANKTAINDITISSINSPSKHTYPIVLFNNVYTECNGILSKMNPACASNVLSTKMQGK